MEITKDPETGQTVTVSRVLLPALKREQHGQELSCEVESTQVENPISSDTLLDKAPRLSISIVIWILSSDTETSAATPLGGGARKVLAK